MDPHLESQLTIRYAFGNGLRKDIWLKLQRRFKIEHIVEFYASTEGNILLFNNTGRPGAIGFVPRIADCLYPVKLLKVNLESPLHPLRVQPSSSSTSTSTSSNQYELCEEASPGEVGLLVGQMDTHRIETRFDGYTHDLEATNKKIFRHVLRPHDQYFNSGDLLRRDRLGFFYWVDRVGDSFRWKGENVSTTEVEEQLCDVPGVVVVSVYGVEVPGCEGRAGMVAILLDDYIDVSRECIRNTSTITITNDDISHRNFNPPPIYNYHSQAEDDDDDGDEEEEEKTEGSNGISSKNGNRCRTLTTFFGDLKRAYLRLPSYARPVFVRMVTNDLRLTSTFKLMKTTFISEGFNPNALDTDELLFYYRPATSNGGTADFMPLSNEMYGEFLANKVKL